MPANSIANLHQVVPDRSLTGLTVSAFARSPPSAVIKFQIQSSNIGSLGLLQKGKRVRYSKWAKGAAKSANARCMTFIKNINSTRQKSRSLHNRVTLPTVIQGKYKVQVHSMWTGYPTLKFYGFCEQKGTR